VQTDPAESLSEDLSTTRTWASSKVLALSLPKKLLTTFYLSAEGQLHCHAVIDFILKAIGFMLCLSGP